MSTCIKMPKTEMKDHWQLHLTVLAEGKVVDLDALLGAVLAMTKAHFNRDNICFLDVDQLSQSRVRKPKSICAFRFRNISDRDVYKRTLVGFRTNATDAQAIHEYLFSQKSFFSEVSISGILFALTQNLLMRIPSFPPSKKAVETLVKKHFNSQNFKNTDDFCLGDIIIELEFERHGEEDGTLKFSCAQGSVGLDYKLEKEIEWMQQMIFDLDGEAGFCSAYISYNPPDYPILHSCFYRQQPESVTYGSHFYGGEWAGYVSNTIVPQADTSVVKALSKQANVKILQKGIYYRACCPIKDFSGQYRFWLEEVMRPYLAPGYNNDWSVEGLVTFHGCDNCLLPVRVEQVYVYRVNMLSYDIVIPFKMMPDDVMAYDEEEMIACYAFE